MIAVGDSVPSTIRRTALSVEPSDVEARGRTAPSEAGAQVDVVAAVSVPAAPDLMRQILSLPVWLRSAPPSNGRALCV